MTLTPGTPKPASRTSAPHEPFLTWAIEARQRLKLALPPLRKTNTGQRITQSRRLALLRRILTDHEPPLRSRVAGCLMLLHAQPASRIVRLSVNDITKDDDGTVQTRLGEPSTPVPEPFASLLLRAAGERENTQTATNPAARWLFPGRRAGQPLHVDTLHPCIRELGIPSAATRLAALHQLVPQAPTPVVAQALGFCYHTTRRHNTGTSRPYTHTARLVQLITRKLDLAR